MRFLKGYACRVKNELFGGFLRASRTLICAAALICAQRAGAQGRISGVVYDSLRTHGPLANATVVLIEPSRYATTDAKGRFSFDSVAPGKYSIGFTHDVLDSLDLQGPIATANVVAGQLASVVLAVPSATTMYARLCPAVHDTSTGMVIGRVRDVDDQSALPNAAVSTEWAEYVISGGKAVPSRMHAATKSGAGGIYLLCGIPTNVALEVRTELAGIVVGPSPLDMHGRIFTRVDFAVSRKDDAAREMPLGATHGDSIAFAAYGPGTAALHGVVRAADGKPLKDAVVSVIGTERSGRSDAAGAFRVEQIPAGTRAIEVKSIGMMPVTFAMDFPTHGTRDTTVSVSKRAQELKAVSVEEHGFTTSLMLNDGFAARQAHGLGSFLTEKDLAKHNYSTLTAVLESVRGMHIAYGTKGYPLPQMLGIMNLTTDYCIPNFWIDGTPYHVDGAAPTASTNPRSQQVKAPYTDISDSVRPEMIKGIEIYTSAGEVPAQYDKFSSTGCGSIVIWTR